MLTSNFDSILYRMEKFVVQLFSKAAFSLALFKLGLYPKMIAKEVKMNVSF